MSVVARVRNIWRYPVKSMMGEELSKCRVDEWGIPGDRGWALRDSVQVRGAKKFPVLMQCRARYRSEPDQGLMPPVEFELPDGARAASDDRDIDARLSDLVGKEVKLYPRLPAEEHEHYRRNEKLDAAAAREMFGRTPDEPLPDLSTIPRDILDEITEFTSPLGTYFDAFPVHLLTTSWLDALRVENPKARFEAPRFRPNFFLEGAGAGFAEEAWCGKRIRIGSVELLCETPTVRCSMTTQATEDLPKDPKVLRTIVQASGQNVGAYARVVKAGTLRVGDPVELL
ncbi:MAG: MOSC domain-containing protein [Myxococcales bacterium]|nr:MOSC domain-containing protein [Myxococcales bacterium]